MRINFKDQEIKAGKFFKFCEKYGADFFETDGMYGVWVIPKQYGQNRMAIKLNDKGMMDFLSIDGENLRDVTSCRKIFPEEQEWLKDIIITILGNWGEARG